MTPEIRQLFADAKVKASEAAQLLAGTPSAENNKRAKDLLAESTTLEERAKLLTDAERIKASADDVEAQEREDLRKQAEAAARRSTPPSAQGSRGTAQNDAGDSRSDAAPDDLQHAVTDDDLTDFRKFSKLFGDFIKEQRARLAPESKKRIQAFRFALVNGVEKLKPEFRKLLSTQRIEHEDGDEFRAMGVQSQSSLGILIPPEVQREVRLAQLAYGGFRGTRTQFLQTTKGRPIPTPTVDDTSNEGTFRGEQAAVAAGTDVVAEPHELGAHSLTSGVMKVSWDLAQDEAFGLESFLVNLGTIRNERRFQRALTTGTGIGQPAGLATTITAGNTAENATAFVNADFYNLLHHPTNGVNSAYHALLEFMLSSDALLNLKLMQGGIGQGLWQPGLGAANPPTIDGKPYVINYHMDTVDTGNVPVFAGDFSWMYAREVVPPYFLRLNELYAGNGQIGFIMATRVDGREVNPGVAALKKMTMA